jgi:GNAT superfamily N-acetyltransferase
MSIDMREEALTLAALAEHVTISIAFVVDRILEVRLIDGGLGGIPLTEAAVIDPCVKDYDAIEGSGPTCWPEHFGISNWGLVCARRDGARVGGAVIAVNTPGLNMLGGRADVAVLWDIRVSPGERGAGIGSALFQSAGAWAGAAAADGSRSRPRMSTRQPAASTRRWAARWALSTGSPIPGCRAKCSCCGGKRWHRAAKQDLANPALALGHKPSRVRSPAARGAFRSPLSKRVEPTMATLPVLTAISIPDRPSQKAQLPGVSHRGSQLNFSTVVTNSSSCGQLLKKCLLGSSIWLAGMLGTPERPHHQAPTPGTRSPSPDTGADGWRVLS